MKISKKIKSPISEELKSFERQFFNSVSSKITLLDLVLKYILKRKGKQIRPILVILFSKMFAKGKIPSKTYRAANLVELIHTASFSSTGLVIYFGRGVSPNSCNLFLNSSYEPSNRNLNVLPLDVVLSITSATRLSSSPK